MSENDTEQEVISPSENAGASLNGETVKAAEPAKKKIRVGYIFLSLLPLALVFEIQTMSQVPFFLLALNKIENDEGVAAFEDPLDLTSRLMQVFNDNYAFLSYLIYAVIGLIVFGIWYYKGFAKKHKVPLKSIVGVKSVVSAIVISVGLSLAISAGLLLAQILFPNVMQSYSELMEAAGIVTNVWITVVYAIILGPILEELAMRGLTCSLLEKAGLRPILVIFISGVLFGVMHMNLVQGIYASFLGFVLAYMRYKYQSIKISIFMHILFNICGSYGTMALDSIGLGDGVYYILGGVSLIAIVFSLVLVNGDKKAYKAAKGE